MKRKKWLVKITVSMALALFVSVSAVSVTVRAGEKEDTLAAEQQHIKNSEIRNGWVDRIDKNIIIIDDMKLRLSPATKYFDLHKKDITKGSVHKGQFVGFLQKNGLITELYLIKPGIADQLPAAAPPARPKTQVRPSHLIKEGGVWKN
ncbi:hypothetical protein MNBD_DELTA04-440 [hydrothermal vent metagenome]|uniref:Uncharacterized protein n=1 Tax=hydrothermal vent metagenome TaxID=652676 RepID=A0A3B0V8T9_9ZZZZ